MSKKLTTEEFIKKAKKVHGNKYDYSLVEYVDSKKKVKIVCSEHGVFKQQPNNHLTMRGCPKCGRVSTISSRIIDKDKFIQKAREIHGDKYDYSLVEYRGYEDKVKIICPDHGVFEQSPHIHSSGSGCRFCSLDKSSLEQRLTKKEFIQKAEEIHSGRYNYSLVEYKNAKTKIKIICPEHGIFEQSPSNHIGKKYKCPYCKESNGEREVAQILGDMKIDFIRQHRFEDCRNRRPLPFDFYIPSLNTAIEYDGEGHFKPIEFMGGEKNLKYRKKNDNIKDNYCKENQINLIRIRYDENIMEKINGIK